MGDARRMRVATIGQEDVTGTHVKALERLAIAGRAQVHFLALQIGQSNGVVQSPLRAGGAGFADHAAVHHAQPAGGQQRLRFKGRR